jgi:uncharacterized membrane protein
LSLRLQAAADVAAPPALVFRLISTPERLPEWNTSIASARRVGSAPVGLGSRAVFAGRLLGQTLESETEVIAYEPPRLFATRALRGPRLETVFRLEPQPFGTHLVVQVSGEVPGGRLGGALAERFLRNELIASLERLRAVCVQEARTSAAAEPLEGGDPACWLDTRGGGLI